MDFEFNSINILIGPQGSGKSITVKLLYFFKNFTNEIIKSIENQESKRDLDRKQKETFITFFPKESWSKDNFSVSYKFDETEIFIKKINNKLTFDYSENLKKFKTKGRKYIMMKKLNLPKIEKYQVLE